MSKTSHVWRVLTLLIVVGIAGFGVQRLLRPRDFGKAGYYRLGSLYEIMNQTPVHQGKEVCNECHDDIYQVHEKDIHFDVKCEDCHGPGNRHVQRYLGGDESVSEQEATVPKEYTLEGCLFCHRKLAARPRTFPQVDPVEHLHFLHVDQPETRCVECHSPHEPLFLLTAVSEARIHPVIYECGDCHDTIPEEGHREVPDHPVIFVCGDCHPAVVQDFETREHAFLRCTACHLFHRESDTAGRIFKNGNRRFCLLCHEKKAFKNEDELPQIVSSEHIAEMAEGMELNPDDLRGEPKVCLSCHFDYIHDSDLIEGRGVVGND